MKKIFSKFLDLVMNHWVLRHLLFWTFILLYFTWGGTSPERNFGMLQSFKRVIAFLPGWMFTVYPILYVLIPKLLLKKRFFAFFISVFLLLFMAAWLCNLADINLIKGAPITTGWAASRMMLPFIHCAALASSIKLIKYYYTEERRVIIAEQQKSSAELELLKAQIHPHFLFNTLNNLYAHTMSNSPQAPEIVLKLSDLLRFMIYESRSEKIPLEHEIQLLKDFRPPAPGQAVDQLHRRHTSSFAFLQNPPILYRFPAKDHRRHFP